VLHRQQYSEFAHTSHFTASVHYGYFTCNTCHDPHKSTVYEQGGILDPAACTDCHPNYIIPEKNNLDCIDCHMPYSTKSATTFNSNRADVRSHQFKIWVTSFPKDSMFYTDSNGTFVKLDSTGKVYGNTLDLVCLRCHQNSTILEMFPYAEKIHTEGLTLIPTHNSPLPNDFVLKQNYPNPFNSTTTIEFVVPNSDFVELSVFDINGKLVKTLFSKKMARGSIKVDFDSLNLSSGVYIYRLTNSTESITKKMLLLK
jgi:hypothetical protein